MTKKHIRRENKASPNLPMKSRYSSYHPIDRSSAIDTPIGFDAKNPKKRIFFKIIIFFLILSMAAAVSVAIWDARNISTASQKLFGSGNLLDLADSSAPITDDKGRINIVLVGYSVDDPGHPAATLTDSIILLSMNPATKSGYILSIPRDLYVRFPGGGYGKINEAYQRGGMELLEQVIARDFKIQPGYYTLFNYAAVRDTVDALEGITVTIDSPDERGLFDPNISPKDGGPLRLVNGSQDLDGQTALNLTRARGDAYNSYGFPQADFDRTQHQRQVLTAIKQRLNWKLILNPIKNQKILNAAADNVKTDIKANEIRSIFGTFNSIPNTNLKSLSLRKLNDKNYLTSYTTPYGQSALIPAAGINNYTEISNALIQFDL